MIRKAYCAQHYLLVNVIGWGVWIYLVSAFSLLANENKTKEYSKVYHYYCTVSDEKHFPLLLNLIGSIHEVDFQALDEIAVFDIGLNTEQKEVLKKIEKLEILEIEKKHPDVLTYFKTDESGRMVRGWYAWKPILLKQALDRYPYFLYLDAGTTVLQPLDDLFKHIEQNGYFLIEIPPHNIQERLTKNVLDQVVSQFDQEQKKELLSSQTFMIDAGFQGISKQIEQTYILPVYQLSSDLKFFIDDGSAPLGFGAGRHDQTLFSIFAHAKKMHLNSQDWTQLKIDAKNVPFHMHWNQQALNEHTSIYRSRWNINYKTEKTAFIKKKCCNFEGQFSLGKRGL